MKKQTIPYIFFDQNVREKMSKKKYKSFQNNVNELAGQRTQRFTAFGLLEFAGLRKEEVFDIQYKDKKLSEYPFHSYEEICKSISNLKNLIYRKITKNFLKEKLKQKRTMDLEYLNREGLNYIDKYITSIETIYDGLIDNLFLDRLSQINISKLSPEDKKRIINKFAHDVVGIICQKRNMGGFRLICKIFKEKRGQIVEGETSKIIEKQIITICEKLKSSGDLMDCELVHLAFFGSNNKHCHCYTTDSEAIITSRLILYCKSIDYFIKWHFDCEKLNVYRRPEWRCGKVFILNKETGDKIKKISVTKIYKRMLEF